MNGAPASLASRRAISVLPTPVGPIIRMFFGSTSSRSALVELQPAPAVAQRDGDRALGVGLADDEAVEFGNDFAGEKSVMRSIIAEARLEAAHGVVRTSGALQRLDGDVAVGVDADFGGDIERAAHDRLGVERSVDRARAAAASA